jgi:UbiD family decarboxylase
MVPADAEIVIEGFVPPHRYEAEGPFAEYTGYQGPQIPNPVIEVACITRRRDAIYNDCGSGLADHLVPDNMAMEAAILTMARHASPALVNVHVPFSGRRYHAYLQFKDPKLGEVRDALLAALSYRRLKAVVAVDEDIDIFDDREVLWAIGTRLQWQRDLITVDGLTEANLDPSTPPGARTTTKAALDATLPPARRSGVPKPVAPPNQVADAARAAAEAALEDIDTSRWPRA